jgi:hypothetical protein
VAGSGINSILLLPSKRRNTGKPIGVVDLAQLGLARGIGMIWINAREGRRARHSPPTPQGGIAALVAERQALTAEGSI